ncbi:META domain-containing protein [Marinimicrobium agarilyticum]|uniref:META domain-containing protein n=1 Tax=Marinimicrobium agarilyticum TaxID=306546 RepID=UPI00041B90B1|nr:META domain-containing protein [Marinimicrobium agarilyticum]
MMIWRAMTALTAALALGACQTEPESPGDVQARSCAGGSDVCESQELPQLPLTARGQEPGWLLNMSQSTLTLDYQYGQKQFSAPTPEPESTANGARYLTRNDGQTLVFELTRDYCEDSMSGMPYPYTATVTLADEATLNGCAGDPRALLVGPEWVVEDINGQGIIDSSRITLNFTENGNVQGLASCNRYNGRYQLTGQGLRIEQLSQTRMACAPALMQQEQKVLETLANVTRFRLDKTGALHLEGGEGKALKAYKSGTVE